MIVDTVNCYLKSAAPGDVTIAVQDFATGTSTGTTSFTSSTLTGLTPASLLVFGPKQLVSDEPNETANAAVCVTNVVGSSGSAIRTFSEDASATTDCRKTMWFTDPAFQIKNVSGGGNHVVATLSTVSGGLSANITTASFSYRAAYVAFAGADVSAATGAINLGTATSAITTSPGFESNAIFFQSIGLGTDNSENNNFDFYFGIATWDGSTVEKRCVLWREGQGLADGSPLQCILTDRVSGEINAGTGAVDYNVNAGNFTSTGFDVTPSANTSSDRLLYHALKLGGRRTKLVDFTTPTSTGSSTISGAGFTPRFALVVLTNLETVHTAGTVGTLTTSDLMGGLGIGLVGDEQWAFAMRIDSGAPTTITKSQMANAAIMGASASDCDAIKASFTAWTSDGMTVNYAAVQGTGKKGFVLFVE